MTNRQILVAGIGNIFFGDDGFGVEVVQKLLGEVLPKEAHVIDFGIRSYDLAYAILQDYEAIILVDATQQGQSPGTLYLIEPDLSRLDQFESEPVNAHSLTPLRVFHMVKILGGRMKRTYLVGCEPAVLETDDGVLGLSAEVERAVPEAMLMIKSLLTRLIAEDPACTNSA